MDAITILRDEHHDVEKLFKKFEDAGDRAYKTKRDLMDRIIRELSLHAAVEELLFYPAVRAAFEEAGGHDDAYQMVLESLEEHHVVKWLLSELDGMDPEHDRFVPKATVLIENVRHHVTEEEDELFPAVRDVLKRNALTDLAETMKEIRQVAPTTPHPAAPDEPPANIVTGLAAGAIDRARQAGRETLQGATDKVREVVGR